MAKVVNNYVNHVNSQNGQNLLQTSNMYPLSLFSEHFKKFLPKLDLSFLHLKPSIGSLL